MCMILNSTKIGNDIVLDCSEYNGIFLGSKILKILDSEQNVFTTSNFAVDKSRNCFGNGGTPWVMVHEQILHNFLAKGNTVIFES